MPSILPICGGNANDSHHIVLLNFYGPFLHNKTADRRVSVSVSPYRAKAIYNNLHGGHNLMAEESKSRLE